MQKPNLNIILCQINSTVGDISSNKNKILDYYNQANSNGPDLVVFPEMIIAGYPIEDMIFRRTFLEQINQAIDELAKITLNNSAILIGSFIQEDDKMFNVAHLLKDGKIYHTYKKHALPNYGIFDEKRTFKSGDLPTPKEFNGINLGVLICHDTWHDHVVKHLGDNKPDITISINGSPYEKGKIIVRDRITFNAANNLNSPLIYLNLTGAQDEIVFDGNSLIIDKNGNNLYRFPAWEECMIETSWQHNGEQYQLMSTNILKSTNYKSFLRDDYRIDYSDTEEVYFALINGLRDYVIKNNFNGVILGLSGGIDSALSAVVAVDALGADKVKTFMLPSKFTSEESKNDAYELAKNLNISCETLDIRNIVNNLSQDLSSILGEITDNDIVAENLQSRARGILLMAISNRTKYLVLSTGNKSELAVGYTTLYGDMCGGFNVLKDVFKTEVYKLAEWRNSRDNIIPKNIIIKDPTAELKYNQKDQDNLPPYHVLDGILKDFIENNATIDEISYQGYDKNVVKEVIAKVYRSEFKRVQSCPGIKVSKVSFCDERRYPITNNFSE